jgi:hypothetical protein
MEMRRSKDLVLRSMPLHRFDPRGSRHAHRSHVYVIPSIVMTQLLQQDRSRLNLAAEIVLAFNCKVLSLNSTSIIFGRLD